MTLIGDIGFCAQTVTIELQTGVDKTGKPTYGAPITFTARIEDKTDYRMTSTGDVVKSKGRVYLVPNGATVPRVGIDRITMALEPLMQPVIIDVSTEVDELGALDHIVVYF